MGTLSLLFAAAFGTLAADHLAVADLSRGPVTHAPSPPVPFSAAAQ